MNIDKIVQCDIAISEAVSIDGGTASGRHSCRLAKAGPGR